MDARQTLLRQLPKIDELLRRDEVQGWVAPRWAVVEALRREVDGLRRAILDGASEGVEVDLDAARRHSEELVRPSLRRVVNATGVVLHTNLGRAPLSGAALAAVVEVGRGYSNLEYDLEAGARGSRHAHLDALVGELCGAEAAAVVNNNAAAVLLCLSACAAGREVIVSRGELIEIGGSFRIPDVMRLSGARLVEVGTSNKTRLGDYEQAIASDTAVLLKVHRSNFRLVGFTEEVDAAELAGLARRRGLVSMIDLGSGSFVEGGELAALGLPPEPDVRATVASGADLVAFSGDKMLGGPQAGVIAGTRDALARVRTHPLMRALRPDKLTLAALEATLRLLRDQRQAEVPVLAMLRAGGTELRARADELARRIGPPGPATVEVVACRSAVGGGALPGGELPSWAVALGGRSAEAIDRSLRRAAVPVIARIADGQVLLDVRTLVGEDDLEDAARAARAALAEIAIADAVGDGATDGAGQPPPAPGRTGAASS
ncbi:MAG TPA: L-seryl-tRNA(Sec) selenium transferase [Kofleriaceae bacterium]|nr:L-seryl-tRNA(Sec) selenium transferase [Kofleriaceae bacterium]